MAKAEEKSNVASNSEEVKLIEVDVALQEKVQKLTSFKLCT